MEHDLAGAAVVAIGSLALRIIVVDVLHVDQLTIGLVSKLPKLGVPATWRSSGLTRTLEPGVAREKSVKGLVIRCFIFTWVIAGEKRKIGWKAQSLRRRGEQKL